MCGIAGMYTYKRSNLQQKYFSWCINTMRRRGPDAEGIWYNNENYITVFTRLAIRDLSKHGNQPMQSDCGKYVISFNGEIYNTVTLSNALKPFAQQYRSASDTELLLYALKYLGVDKTLSIADGMFAFALYDVEKNELLLARDRIGIKPLYIGESGSGVVYSSQYDHIINHAFFSDNSLDENVIAAYLCLGFVPDNMGVVKQTRLLPHGHYMIVGDGATKLVRYYQYATATGTNNKEQSFEKILSASVNSQLVSDVPVGTFMSGGVDSTLVSYYANQHQHIDAFTIGVKGHEMDEAGAAKTYAEKFRLHHHCKYITANDMLALVEENAAAYSEPFADYSSIPTLLLSQFAKEKVTVALSGDGPDELFWGYSRSVNAGSLLALYSKGETHKRMKLLSQKLQNPKGTHLSRHWNSGEFTDYYYSTLFITGALQLQKSILNYQPLTPLFFEDAVNAFSTSGSDADALMQIVKQLEVDIHLQRILLKVDRASMYHSLEVRVPYLSNAMLDYSSHLSPKSCINNKEGKVNVKKLLAEKFGAEQVLKEKRGFRIPLKEWMRHELKKDITEKIMGMPPSLVYLFNKQTLKKIIDEHMSAQHDHSWLLWAVYSLVRWDEMHRGKW